MSYIGNEPIVSATRTVTEVTATAGQTVFTANGGYTVGFLDVFINGSKLTSADFTATNGSTVTLTEAAQVSDIVRLEALGTFQAANAVLLTGNSNLTGNLNVSGNLGVGTTSPAEKLEVSGGANTAIRVTASSGNSVFRYARGGVDKWTTYVPSSDEYIFFSNAAATERMRINSGGQLFTTIDGTSSVLADYGCRAWVNFNGTGTVSIRGSGNVSSITDNGTGVYTLNFTNAMPDTNYAISGTCVNATVQHQAPSNVTVNGVQVVAVNRATGSVDTDTINVAVFR